MRWKLRAGMVKASVENAPMARSWRRGWESVSLAMFSNNNNYFSVLRG